MRAWLGGPGRPGDLPGWVRGTLTEICTGSRVPPAVKHPLGFLCVQLYRSAGWGLCMHIWGSRQTPSTLTTSAIHSHSWDLSSQVICGRLENLEIRVMNEASAPTHRVMEITSAGGCDVLRPTRRLVSCASNVSSRIGAGESYSLPAGAFHASKPIAAGLTVTVLLAEDRRTSPDLALGRLDARCHVVRRRACPVSDLRSIAGVTLRDLDARSHDTG